MSATNTTTNLGLSQFVNTDVPAWRQDYNGDMLKIDNAYTADISGATAETSADPSDYMKFYDVSATTNKKILISDLLKGAKVEDLTDTDITTPIDNDGLVYDATAQKWENKQITTKEQWQKNGAYNLCPNNATSQVIQGVTYTVKSDGTISASNTASSNSVLGVCEGIKFKAGTYKVVGTPTGGNYNTGYSIYVQRKSDYSTVATDAPNSGGLTPIFVADGNTEYNVLIMVRSGATSPANDFKPMITTDLNATYDDYVPHAKTNRELTEYATTKVGSLSASQYTTSAENVKVRQVGNSVHIWGFCNNNIQHSDGSNNNVLGTITGVTLPKTDEAVRTVCGIAAHAYDVPQQVGYLSLATNGELIFKTTQTGTKSVYFDISYAV